MSDIKKDTDEDGATSTLTQALGTLKQITKDDLFKINLPNLTGAYIYKSLLHDGYLICKDEGVQQKVIVNEVFKTVTDAEAYISLRTSA